MDYKSEMARLRRELTEAGYRYYVLDDPSIPDYEYDQMLRRLEELEAEEKQSGKKDEATDFDDEFQAEVDHFIDCFANGEPCRSPAEDGVQIMRILDAVYESARTGHEVIL